MGNMFVIVCLIACLLPIWAHRNHMASDEYKTYLDNRNLEKLYKSHIINKYISLQAYSELKLPLLQTHIGFGSVSFNNMHDILMTWSENEREGHRPAGETKIRELVGLGQFGSGCLHDLECP